MFRIICLILSGFTIGAAELPNILWIVSEDNDKHWLGCYGNEQAKTPNLDALAARSVKYENFYSNAPVCAVARSTILTGVHAPSQGTQHMRSQHAIPNDFKTYVTYLREAGYYTTNASKTDYNSKENGSQLWDESKGSAHYKNRKEGQPFFAVFNLMESHESSLFPDKIASRRKKGLLPQTPRLDPAKVFLRPFLPDLPAIRSDIAIYHDNITLMDQRVGKLLAELERESLAENTIVIYCSDHGGVTPRGKRYLKDTGVNVPLLIHFPQKYLGLAGGDSKGTYTLERASFVDLAPTFLSLAGVEKPAQMQGHAFLGNLREKPSDDDYVFLYADRFDEIYGMRRGLTDGRWKYIRRFTPQYPAAPYSYYQFGQPGWKAWQDGWKAGTLKPRFNRIWEPNEEVEELFDTEADPWEINNLAHDANSAAQLKKMRQALSEKMVVLNDTGLIPEAMFAELGKGKPIAKFVSSQGEDWKTLVEFSFLATSRNPEHLPLFQKKLASENVLERYWAAQGCIILGPEAVTAEKELRKLLADPHSVIRAAAAQALITIGKPDGGYEVLVKELSNQNEFAQLNAVNILTQLDAGERIPDSWILSSRGKGKRNYPSRVADRLAKERGL